MTHGRHHLVNIVILWVKGPVLHLVDIEHEVGESFPLGPCSCELALDVFVLLFTGLLFQIVQFEVTTECFKDINTEGLVQYKSF